MKLPLNIKLAIGVIILVIIHTFSITVYDTVKNMHNDTQLLKLSYSSESQKQITNYDGYYQMFKDKYDMSQINKETFITVTDIIMFGRKDGENLAWKWNAENQYIPYEEFSAFYHNLSLFVEDRYKDNMLIENRKQEIVKQHNFKLNMFPNNILNKIMQIEPLTYKQGYVSQETLDKFK